MVLAGGRSLGVAAVLLVATGPAGAAPTAPQALAECRALIESGDPGQAIGRCEEASALDFGLAEVHFLLGRAHASFALPPKDGEAASALTPAQREEHRRKAMESFRRFLAVDTGSAPAGSRTTALGELMGLYILGDEKDEAVLAYADELARTPALPFNYLVYLAGANERHERWADSERFMKKAMEANPSHVESCMALAATYNRPVWNGRPRFDDMVATLERCARITPGDPVPYRRLARLLFDKVYRDASLGAGAVAAYVSRGLAHADNALALDDSDYEALVYKGLLLRAKARDTADPGEQQRLIEEAGALQARAKSVRAAGTRPRPDPYEDMFPPESPSAAPAAAASPVPAPPPAVPPLAPIRVGGQIKEPKRLVKVDPVYPDIAKQARVQGVVILECTIDPRGRVSDLKVLRGIPLLDQAAIDAVRQWVYSPTLFNGVPVPVIMTVTVTFTLS